MPPETQCDNCGIITELDLSRPPTCFQCTGKLSIRKTKRPSFSLVDMLGAMEVMQVLKIPIDKELRQVLTKNRGGYPKPKRRMAKTVTITQGKPLARTLRKFPPVKVKKVYRKTTAADLAAPLRIKRVGIS